jgi:hypothetical protein
MRFREIEDIPGSDGIDNLSQLDVIDEGPPSDVDVDEFKIETSRPKMTELTIRYNM